MEPEKKSTDPQQSEMDGNVLGGIFQTIAGDTKGRAPSELDGTSASQTAGVDDNDEEVSKDE